MIKEKYKETGYQDTPVISMTSKTIRRYPSASLLILALPILLVFLSIAIHNWNQVFDDAFISYRYSQNLALGHGITWNPSEPPTEGYTNFLLVLILAPAIWAGLDPLLVTRVLSFISVIAMSGILFTIARRRYSCSATTAFMIAALVFLVPATRIQCLIGLETVIYAFFLLATFIAGITFIDRQQINHSIVFVCLLFLTMLLRPEAALLYPIIFTAFVIAAVRNQTTLKPLLIGCITLLIIGGAYLSWKYLHFGQLLPNPFYLKVSGQTLISPEGIHSVKLFISDYALLLILSLSSVILSFFLKPTAQPWNKLVTLIGFIFVIVYCLFFVHVDTLMDTYGRFLYPLAPLVILLAIPTLAKTLNFLESISIYKIPALPGVMVVFLIAFGPPNIINIYGNIKNLMLHDQLQASESIMQKEYRISKVLARFPRITEVRVAFNDSGVIPYFTGAIWLDTVGLNDGFIARTLDQSKLADYFFNWSPDLVIHPGKAEQSWLRNGHGPLGDFLSWTNDPRWDEYEYIGTSKTSDSLYDLQYFVRKSSRFRISLEYFLKEHVVDGWYDPFPLSIGTYKPSMERRPIWYQRAESHD
jgi:arabinofuranosyltransferase